MARGPVLENPEIRIENVVATSTIGAELNLNAIAIALEGAEYEPEQFPGLVYRIDDPKVVALLFSTGKIVCTGAKQKKDITRAVERIQTELSNAGLL